MQTERVILKAVADGDLEAFGELVRAHQARVRLACLVWLGSAEEADDAAQEIFVKAFKALGQFKGDASFLTWILRIADNHCRDVLRTRKARRTESLDMLLAEKGDVFEGLLARLDARESTLTYAPKELELLGKLFGALSQEDREILALSEVEGLAYKDIAERLGCTLDAV